MEDMDIHTVVKVMATVILYLMAVWDMDTVMEATATVTSPNTDTTITDIHTEDTDIHTEDMGIHTMILTATMTIRSHPEKAPASRYYKEFFSTLLRTRWAVSVSSYLPS